MSDYIKREDALIHQTLVHAADEPYWVVPVHAIERIHAADVVENAKRTTFEPDAARDLKNFVEACDIDEGIMDGFAADRIRTYLYALIDEATIGFDWQANEEETREQRADRHLQHIIDMGKRKDGDAHD